MKPLPILFALCILARPEEPSQIGDFELVDYVKPDIELGSFNTKDISVPELLRQISKEKQVNIVVDDRVGVRLTLQLHDTSLNELLNLLAHVYGLQVEVAGTIVHVRPPVPVKPEPPLNEIEYDSAKDTLSFELTGMELEAFARELTARSGKNVLLRERTLKASLKGYQAPLPFEKALTVLLETNGLELEKDGDIFFVAGRKHAIAMEPDSAGQPVRGPENEGRLNFLGVKQSGDLFDLKYQDAALADILRDLADTGNLALVVQGRPEGTLSIDVKGVDSDTLFELLLADTNYSYVLENGVYIIGQGGSKALYDTRVVSLKHLNAEMVEQTLPQTLREGASVTIVKELNSLLLSGERSKINSLANLIEEMDLPVPQVLIEVVVVDYTFTNNREVGLELTNGPNAIFPELDLGLEGYRDESGSFQVRRLPSNFTLAIRALEDQGKARIISKPHVAALNGHEAFIKIGSKQFYRIENEELVGDQNPRVRTSQEIREIEANIYLKITPWVTGNGEVTTLIEPTFTSFLGQVNDNIPPPISSRELKSTVRLKDGETIILGGLIEKFDTVDQQGVPWLSRVPLLGALFRNHRRSKRQSELVIYITPHIYYGHEGSVEFIREQEGLEYQLDVKKQQQGVKAKSPGRRPWYKRLRRGGGEVRLPEEEVPKPRDQGNLP